MRDLMIIIGHIAGFRDSSKKDEFLPNIELRRKSCALSIKTVANPSNLTETSAWTYSWLHGYVGAYHVKYARKQMLFSR
jgi:hypothetical protein